MKKFNYIAIDNRGSIIKHFILSKNKKLAKKELFDRGYYIKSISVELNLSFFNKVNTRTKSKFFYQLYNIMRSGVDIIMGVELIIDKIKNPYFKTVLHDILKSLQDGNSLYESFSIHKKIFSNIVIQQIKAGELGSNIEEVLHDIHLQYEEEYKLKNSVKSAFVYPTIISILGIVIFNIIIFKVIPVLKEALSHIDAELPFITLFILEHTNNILNYLIIVLVFVLLLLIFVYLIKTNKKIGFLFDKYILKVPLLGEGIYYFQEYIFSKIFCSLLNVGMPVVDIFDILILTIKNKYMLKGIKDCRKLIDNDGSSLSDVLGSSNVFKDEFIQLISIGENTGRLPETLSYLSIQSREELEDRLKKIIQYISPAILCFVLVVIGVMIVALMIPMITLVDQI